MSARRLRKAAGAVDDLKDTQAILHQFTRAGRAQRVQRPVNLNDEIEVVALELLGRITSDPRNSTGVGAWLSRMKLRGSGVCTPLHGAAEGLHVLVLDAQAMVELTGALADHEEQIASYENLHNDLARIRKMREDAGRNGEAD